MARISWEEAAQPQQVSESAASAPGTGTSPPSPSLNLSCCVPLRRTHLNSSSTRSEVGVLVAQWGELLFGLEVRKLLEAPRAVQVLLAGGRRRGDPGTRRKEATDAGGVQPGGGGAEGSRAQPPERDPPRSGRSARQSFPLLR